MPKNYVKDKRTDEWVEMGSLDDPTLTQTDLLQMIVIELKIMNKHLGILSDAIITDGDVS